MVKERSEEEKLEKLAETKRILTKKLEEMEMEIKLIQECLKAIDEELVKKSFVTAEKLVEIGGEKVSEGGKTEELKEKEYVKITYKDREMETVIARIYIDEKGNLMKIKLEQRIPINASLIQNFLINGVLEKMRIEDEEKVDKGELRGEEALKYYLERDGEILKEIKIINVKSEERKIRIRNAAKWTFTKIYEKTIGEKHEK
ncbi:MAG: hypothetical protein QXX09_02390 [Candidatus Methanomethylicia archaeon]